MQVNRSWNRSNVNKKHLNPINVYRWRFTIKVIPVSFNILGSGINLLTGSSCSFNITISLSYWLGAHRILLVLLYKRTLFPQTYYPHFDNHFSCVKLKLLIKKRIRPIISFSFSFIPLFWSTKTSFAIGQHSRLSIFVKRANRSVGTKRFYVNSISHLFNIPNYRWKLYVMATHKVFNDIV